jgi:hypothetical protein
MRITRTLAAIAAASLAVCGAAIAQTLKHPLAVSDQYLSSIGARLQYSRTNKMSADARAAVQEQQSRIVSVPAWDGSFTTGGVKYPYAMVGRTPFAAQTTVVPTSLIPISFFFDEYVDASGNNIIMDVTPVIGRTLNSPDFEPASYGTGFTQFADAVQRAEFFGVMDSHWHTLIASPRKLTPVQVEVPPGAAQLFETPTGTILALLDGNFFDSQLNTIVQLENLKETELAIALTANVLLFDPASGQCCVGGFHTAFETRAVGSTHFVQTFAWASWMDPGIFIDPSVADVTAISHEISEWMNDPFVNNATPSWQFPDGSGNCQANLETGDPIEVLTPAGFPVQLDGFLYHPQNEALIEWFSRQKPSTAFQGSYSFPNESLLTKPSVACGP